MPCRPPEKSFQSIGLIAASETFTWIWPVPAEGISTSASLRLAMVSAGLPSAPYAEACQAFMVGMFIADAVVVKRAGVCEGTSKPKNLRKFGKYVSGDDRESVTR